MTREDHAARDAAMLLLGAGRAQDALLKLRDGFDATDPWCWFVRASALLRLERYDDCIEAAKEGLALDGENVHLLDALAAARVARSDLAGAEEAILSALRVDAEDADLLTRYASIVARAGQAEKAEKLVARALGIDPENQYALQMHALLATAAGDTRETITRSRELLRHAPEHPLGHRLIGASLVERGRILDADDAFTNAVRLDPSDDETADAARETHVLRHWLLWPLRPAMRVGGVALWLGAVVTMLVLRALQLHTALAWFVGAWIAYCVYSWIAPPFVRWLMRRR